MLAVALAATAQPAFAQQEEASLALPALTFNFAAAYIAEDKGYWRDAGLALKIHDIAGLGAMNAVLSSSVDFSIGSTPSFVRANIRGQKLLALGTVLDGVVQELVLSKAAANAAGITEASPIEKRAQALKGKTIATDSPNTIPHALIRYVARKGGVDPEKEIKVAMMAPPAALAALKSGQIDGFANPPPWGVIPVQEGTAILIGSGPRGDFPELMPISNSVVLTRPDLCDKKPTVCQKLMDGLARAIALMRDNPKEALAVLGKKITGMEPAVMEASFEQNRRMTPPTMRVNEAVFANVVKFMQIGGMLGPDDKLASTKDIFTTRFVR